MAKMVVAAASKGLAQVGEGGMVWGAQGPSRVLVSPGTGPREMSKEVTPAQ